MALCVLPAAAQQPLPGLVITAPPPNNPAATPPSPPERPSTRQAPARKPAAKPAPQAKSGGSGRASGGSGQSILVLVNDDPITAYEVDQRARLIALQANVGAQAQENLKRLVQSEETTKRWRRIVEETVQENQGRSRDEIMAILEKKKAAFGDSLRNQAIESAKSSIIPSMRKTALDELIDERLKIQEARRLNVKVGDQEVSGIIRGIAERNKMTEEQFAQHVAKLGGNIESMRARFFATLSWNEVVRRRFGHQVNINERDVDRFVSQTPSGDDQIELQVQRISLPVPAKLDQRAMAQRLDEAERIRRTFTNCKGLPALAAGAKDAKLENLGIRRPETFDEPARTMLLNAKENEMVPPNMGQGGIELYAVCGRKALTAGDKARTQAAAELRQQEFELLARRHLKDLRQDAHIEYR